jgi:hypothetical protein
VAGCGSGKGDLPAQADRRLVEDDLVACRMRLGGGGHPGGAPAHDGHALPLGGTNRHPRSLAPGTRVLRAGDRDSQVIVGDAGVAADAAEDVLDAAICRLARKVRIRDERARHAHGSGHAVGDHPIGSLRVDDA